MVSKAAIKSSPENPTDADTEDTLEIMTPEEYLRTFEGGTLTDNQLPTAPDTTADRKKNHRSSSTTSRTSNTTKRDNQLPSPPDTTAEKKKIHRSSLTTSRTSNTLKRNTSGNLETSPPLRLATSSPAVATTEKTARVSASSTPLAPEKKEKPLSVQKQRDKRSSSRPRTDAITVHNERKISISATRLTALPPVVNKTNDDDKTSPSRSLIDAIVLHNKRKRSNSATRSTALPPVVKKTKLSSSHPITDANVLHNERKRSNNATSPTAPPPVVKKTKVSLTHPITDAIVLHSERKRSNNATSPTAPPPVVKKTKLSLPHPITDAIVVHNERKRSNSATRPTAPPPSEKTKRHRSPSTSSSSESSTSSNSSDSDSSDEKQRTATSPYPRSVCVIRPTNYPVVVAATQQTVERVTNVEVVIPEAATRHRRCSSVAERSYHTTPLVSLHDENGSESSSLRTHTEQRDRRSRSVHFDESANKRFYYDRSRIPHPTSSRDLSNSWRYQIMTTLSNTTSDRVIFLHAMVEEDICYKFAAACFNTVCEGSGHAYDLKKKRHLYDDSCSPRSGHMRMALRKPDWRNHLVDPKNIVQFALRNTDSPIILCCDFENLLTNGLFNECCQLTRLTKAELLVSGGKETCSKCYPEERSPVYVFWSIEGHPKLLCHYHAKSLGGSPGLLLYLPTFVSMNANEEKVWVSTLKWPYSHKEQAPNGWTPLTYKSLSSKIRLRPREGFHDSELLCEIAKEYGIDLRGREYMDPMTVVIVMQNLCSMFRKSSLCSPTEDLLPLVYLRTRHDKHYRGGYVSAQKQRPRSSHADWIERGSEIRRRSPQQHRTAVERDRSYSPYEVHIPHNRTRYSDLRARENQIRMQRQKSCPPPSRF